MKSNHNKDYSVVKTLGSLVLNGGFFYTLPPTLSTPCTIINSFPENPPSFHYYLYLCILNFFHAKDMIFSCNSCCTKHIQILHERVTLVAQINSCECNINSSKLKNLITEGTRIYLCTLKN